MRKDICLSQGADHVEVFNLEVLSNPQIPYDPVTNPYTTIDLTPYTAVLTVRTAYDGPSVLTLTTGTGITLTNGGQITILFLGQQTQQIQFTGSFADYVYDLELMNLGYVKRPAQGKFKISRNATY